MTPDHRSEAGATVARESPYEQQIRSEGLDVLIAREPRDLTTVELQPWARRGCRGVCIWAAGPPLAADCYVCELPPGERLAAQSPLFEEIVLVLAGRGSSTFAIGGSERHSFEWKAGTLFALPRNVTYRHFNGSGKSPARFLAVTTAPATINALSDAQSDFDYREAFAGGFSRGDDCGAVDLNGACGLDALDSPLIERPACGAGGHLHSSMGTKRLSIWISQLPPATYGKAHAYAADAFTVVLSGAGCTLAGPAGGEHTCWRWQQGSLIAAPAAWWRQHFNIGAAPARMVTFVARVAAQQGSGDAIESSFSTVFGGAYIDYANEAAGIRAWFNAALAERGLEARMDRAYAAEAGGE